MPTKPNYSKRGEGTKTFTCPGCGNKFKAWKSKRSRNLAFCKVACATSYYHRQQGHGGKSFFLCACGCERLIERYPSQVPGAQVFHSREAYLRSKRKRYTVGRRPKPKPVDPQQFEAKQDKKRNSPTARKWAGVEKILKKKS